MQRSSKLNIQQRLLPVFVCRVRSPQKKKKTCWLTDSIHLDFVISIGFHLFPFAPARCQECQSLTAAVHEGLLSNSLEGAPTSHRPGDAVEYPRLGSSSHLGQRFDLVTSGYLGYVVTHVVTLEICKMLFRYIRHISGHGVLYFPGSERQNAFRARHKRAPVRVSWLQKSVQGSKTPVEAVILHGSLTLKPCRTWVMSSLKPYPTGTSNCFVSIGAPEPRNWPQSCRPLWTTWCK